MKSAFLYQFLVDVHLRLKEHNLPVFLRDTAKKGDIQDFKKLEEALKAELANTPLESNSTVEYFLFLVKEALGYFFFRKDYDGFTAVKEVLHGRFNAWKSMGGAADVQPWEVYVSFLDAAFKRLLRHESIETYENEINHLDWSGFHQGFIAYLSAIIGFVYLNEEDSEQAGKSRLWIQKAIHESDANQNLLNFVLLAQYHLTIPSDDNRSRVADLIAQIQSTGEASGDELVQRQFNAAAFELEVANLSGTFKVIESEDAFAQLEDSQESLRQMDVRFRQMDILPEFSKCMVESIFAEHYLELIGLTNDDLEQNNFARFSLRYLELAADRANAVSDEPFAMSFRLRRFEIAVKYRVQTTEKEVKDVFAYFKKNPDHTAHLRAVAMYANLYENNGAGAKINDLLQNVFKAGQKTGDTGSFYLMVGATRIGIDFFLKETEKPGVSWMVAVLDQLFEKISKLIDLAEENIVPIGNSLIREFLKEYARFEPASHFNIKTYFRYQWGAVKIAHLGAVMNQDADLLKVVDILKDELENSLNPLSFVKADWEEFRLVPNSVRNKTLNKCINISKGDLPLAAEHLDFSYRNLRSYITFKEVNRLGFFLEQQHTNNRQLEQGIRLMFFDLYKSGTIFEVVFDMPKFLVQYAKSGFYALDMERDLSIKGTTAKKYLKIMTEVNLIRQDRTTGRKHFYRLMRENVMNRLGKEQTTLIK